MKYVTTANSSVSAAVKANKFEKMDWGMRVVVENELDALRIAYIYRKNKYGCTIEHHGVGGLLAVIIWNELGNKLEMNK